MSWPLARGCAAMALVGVSLAAQIPQAKLPSEIRAELSQLESHFANQADTRDRMVDLLAQHALGWSVSDATSLMIERVLDATERDNARVRLAKLQRELASLHGEYQRLNQDAGGLAGLNGGAAEGGETGWDTMPTAGSLPAPGDAATGANPSGHPDVAGANTAGDWRDPGQPGAAPLGEGARAGSAGTDRAGTRGDTERTEGRDEDRMFALVKGSEDHGAVGRLLFLAGRALHRKGDQFAAAGDAGQAAEFRGRSRRKYEQGVRELRHASLGLEQAAAGAETIEESAVYPDDAKYIDLFHESKCLLGLFDLDIAEGTLGLSVDVKAYDARIEAVRRPLLVITSRDAKQVEGTQQLGKWGTAAEALLDQLRWRMTQDSYQPVLPDIGWREGETR